MNLLDTHYYDGRLREQKERVPDLSSIVAIPLEQKKNVLTSFRDTIFSSLSPTAQASLDIIVGSIGTAANYDPSNDLWVDDLLYLCSQRLFTSPSEFNRDFLELLTVQLEEMQSGLCPQGRTHRLFQILVV